MIFELRTYTTPAGRAPQLAQYSAEIGRPIRGDDYGKLEGYWLTEIGPLNQVMHLWSYDDLNDRQAKRAALGKNDRWRTEFLPKAGPLILRQDIRLMDPVRPLAPPTTAGNVYEYRHYRCKTGKAVEFANAINEAMPVRERHSKNVGLWVSIAGQPNEVSHLWVYESLNHRALARAAATADPDWRAFLAKGGPLLEEMTSTVLLPTASSPMK
ncbi:MAG: NIPSNAP family protein [Hyphomicrobiaceae bacterium]